MCLVGELSIWVVVDSGGRGEGRKKRANLSFYFFATILSSFKLPFFFDKIILVVD